MVAVGEGAEIRAGDGIGVAVGSGIGVGVGDGIGVGVGSGIGVGVDVGTKVGMADDIELSSGNGVETKVESWDGIDVGTDCVQPNPIIARIEARVMMTGSLASDLIYSLVKVLYRVPPPIPDLTLAEVCT